MSDAKLIEEQIGSIVGAMISVGLLALVVFGPLVAAPCAVGAGIVTWVFRLNFFQELDKCYLKSLAPSLSESSSASSYKNADAKPVWGVPSEPKT
jgi:hypothetical protein